jgi:hypothetical protein
MFCNIAVKTLNITKTITFERSLLVLAQYAIKLSSTKRFTVDIHTRFHIRPLSSFSENTWVDQHAIHRIFVTWVISDFHCELDGICGLLEYYAEYSCNSLPTFRDKLSVPTSRVKKLLNIILHIVLRNIMLRNGINPLRLRKFELPIRTQLLKSLKIIAIQL